MGLAIDLDKDIMPLKWSASFKTIRQNVWIKVRTLKNECTFYDSGAIIQAWLWQFCLNLIKKNLPRYHVHNHPGDKFCQTFWRWSEINCSKKKSGNWFGLNLIKIDRDILATTILAINIGSNFEDDLT